jgi:hypothetical protein
MVFLPKILHDKENKNVFEYLEPIIGGYLNKSRGNIDFINIDINFINIQDKNFQFFLPAVEIGCSPPIPDPDCCLARHPSRFHLNGAL